MFNAADGVLNNIYDEALKDYIFSRNITPLMDKVEPSFPDQDLQDDINGQIKLLTGSIYSCSDTPIYVVQDCKFPQQFTALIFGLQRTSYENAGLWFHINVPDNYPLSHLELRHIQTYRLSKLSKQLHPLITDGILDVELLNTTGTVKRTMSRILKGIQKNFLGSRYFTDNYPIKKKHYSQRARLHSVAIGMYDLLKNTPSEFKDVIEKHFAIRGDQIRDTLQNWKNKQDFSYPECCVKYNNKTLDEWITLIDPLIDTIQEKFMKEFDFTSLKKQVDDNDQVDNDQVYNESATYPSYFV